MSRKCEICGKGLTFGIQYSHSHRRSNRTWAGFSTLVSHMILNNPFI